MFQIQSESTAFYLTKAFTSSSFLLNFLVFHSQISHLLLITYQQMCILWRQSIPHSSTNKKGLQANRWCVVLRKAHCSEVEAGTEPETSSCLSVHSLFCGIHLCLCAQKRLSLNSEPVKRLMFFNHLEENRYKYKRSITLKPTYC